MRRASVMRLWGFIFPFDGEATAPYGDIIIRHWPSPRPAELIAHPIVRNSYRRSCWRPKNGARRRLRVDYAEQRVHGVVTRLSWDAFGPFSPCRC